MTKYNVILVILVALSSGCSRKKVIQERICARIDFERIVSLFPKTVSEIKALVEKSKHDMDQVIELIGDISASSRTYQNTPLAYEQAYFQFFLNSQILHVLATASCDSDMQAQAYDAFFDLQRYKNTVLKRNVTLYQAFDEYERFGKDTYRKITSVNYFLHDMLHRFERDGMHLSVAKRTDLINLENEIKDLQQRFYRNVDDQTGRIVAPKKELYGMSDEYVNSLIKDQSGNYILPINSETYAIIMEHCLVEATRKSYFMMFFQQAHCVNRPILEKLIYKRNEYAQLLNFKDFATYQLQDLMIKSPKKAEDFLWKMVKALQPYEDKSFKDLTQHLPPSVELVGVNQLKPWDVALVKSWYKEKHFGLSNDQVSEYFSLDSVVSGFLERLGRFFHLEFEHQKTQGIWAPDVLCYRVRSLKNQAIIGYIFLDLYQRPFKKISKQSYMMIIPAIRDDCSISCVGSSVIMANFAYSTSDKPTLLTLDEVTSLFHEMGHSIHALFGSTRFTQFSGPQVAKDFVHVPSVLLEYWFNEPEIWLSIGRHYKTGAHVPKDMIEKIIALQKFDRTGRMLQELFLSLVSLHVCKNIDEKDTHAMIEKLYKNVFKHIAYEPNCYFENSFSNLADDFAGVYYRYPWSQIIAADLFAYLKKEGFDDYRTGDHYVSEMLSPGGSKNPQDMIKRLLGRSWNTHAFLESL